MHIYQVHVFLTFISVIRLKSVTITTCTNYAITVHVTSKHHKVIPVICASNVSRLPTQHMMHAQTTISVTAVKEKFEGWESLKDDFLDKATSVAGMLIETVMTYFIINSLTCRTHNEKCTLYARR